MSPLWRGSTGNCGSSLSRLTNVLILFYLFRGSVLLDVVLTGNWRCEGPLAQRGAGPPTSESHPGKQAACWCGYLATGWLCHPSLNKNRKKNCLTEVQSLFTSLWFYDRRHDLHLVIFLQENNLQKTHQHKNLQDKCQAHITKTTQ